MENFIITNDKIEEGDFIIDTEKSNITVNGERLDMVVVCKKILNSDDLIWESVDGKSSACDSICQFRKVQVFDIGVWKESTVNTNDTFSVNKKQAEQLRFIEIANNLNQTLYEKHGDAEDKFFYSTDGYIDVFGFGNKTLWCSEMDDREFVESINDYEGFEPFIIEKFNNWVAAIGEYSL